MLAGQCVISGCLINTSLTPILHCESALAWELVLVLQSQAYVKTWLRLWGEGMTDLDLLLHYGESQDGGKKQG